MNLASILNLTPAAPGAPTSPEAALTPATSLVTEFSALLGMAALPQATNGSAANLAANTGKNLPDLAAEEGLPGDPAALMALPAFLIITLPKEPETPAQAGLAQPDGQVVQGTAPEALLPMTGIPAGQPASLAANAGAPAPATGMAAAPALPPAPAPAPASSAAAAPQIPAATPPAPGLQVQIDLLPSLQFAAPVQRAPLAETTAPSAQQLAALPAVQAFDPRRDLADRAASSPATAATAMPKEAEPKGAAPVAAATMPLQSAPVTMAGSAPEPARTAPVDVQPATPTATRHDFSAVVDRLSEARELAQPGRATMQLAHREFGAINVQFDMAGQSLKVGLASSDAAFAPAVQAALATQAERPVIASGEAQGSRSDQQRSDQPQPATQSTSTPASQGDGQARDQQARGAQARHPSDQVQRQPQDGGERGENPAASSRARDGSLFA